MNAIEKRIEELRRFLPMNEAPSDLHSFWQRNLNVARSRPLQANSEKQDNPLDTIEVTDLSYNGFDETRVHAWYIRPQSTKTAKMPTVILFPGYTAAPANPEAYTVWTNLGYAVVAIHIRGQTGLTGNALPTSTGMVKGYVTQNITDREQNYYMATTIDCIRAVDWVREQSDLDPERIALVGGSQGGGLALITAALSENIRAVVADIPNLCHMDFGMLHSTGSLTEIAQYCKQYPQHLQQVLDTLAYYDMLHLASWISAPVMMSVGLKDMVCMPETIFPVYTRIQTEKSLEIYPFCGHEVVQEQVRKGIMFVKKQFN